jgi:hypothetical protein
LKTNLSSYNSALSFSAGVNGPNLKPQIGKVYGAVTTLDTPTPELFKEAGGWDGIGIIYYRVYNNSKEIEESLDTLTNLPKAYPLFPHLQYIPLVGELVYLIDLPSPVSQGNKKKSNTPIQKYYITINLWNNVQENSIPASDDANLGITFKSNPNVRKLISFEGDTIIQGRQGNSLRLGTTAKISSLNEWSSVGDEVDPITLLVNGLDFNPSSKYYVERINKDNSSIYLTSTQKIPLQTDKTGTLNPLTNPLNAPDYFNSQIILNADRVTLNSKKDEVMIFAKTNVEINTKNIINLNANERVHLNTNAIFLGTVNNELPTENLVLGNRLYNLLDNLLEGLSTFGNSLSTVVGSPEGAPAMDIINAAEGLLNDIERAENALETILSQTSFTS